MIDDDADDDDEMMMMKQDYKDGRDNHAHSSVLAEFQQRSIKMASAAQQEGPFLLLLPLLRLSKAEDEQEDVQRELYYGCMYRGSRTRQNTQRARPDLTSYRVLCFTLFTTTTTTTPLVFAKATATLDWPSLAELLAPQPFLFLAVCKNRIVLKSPRSAWSVEQAGPRVDQGQLTTHTSRSGDTICWQTSHGVGCFFLLLLSVSASSSSSSPWCTVLLEASIIITRLVRPPCSASAASAAASPAAAAAILTSLASGSAAPSTWLLYPLFALGPFYSFFFFFLPPPFPSSLPLVCPLLRSTHTCTPLLCL
ncbi:uncharacterized protein ARB_07705 [Trichophyton benhamiae CBS 112371]|uniref:Uncharacterized protein n=1 Tax=Arthroderma benhamiae (strain ATCC MYA-4681 / CBS 112371) TaxID=663331 RepID=D4AU75_ARTBC|nr:uncharacterized protein ARB_07705 [Trichophyton benhamiae CBS 112371]EFE33345.1 hypothetical protein ARB_07705 [Trichophyton benhamiae CBS 112371]